MPRKPLGKKGMKSIVQRKDQKKVLQERKEVEEIKHMREKRNKLNKIRRRKYKKELKQILNDYKNLTKMITKTTYKEELKVLDLHKKDLDKEYKEVFTKLYNLPNDRPIISISIASPISMPNPPAVSRSRRNRQQAQFEFPE